MKTDLTWERLTELLVYNKNTGVFSWKVQVSNVCSGQIAGTKNGNGYWQIRIDNKIYPAHRLAWFYVKKKWPVKQIDHKNLDKADNRFGNLREASNAENGRNRNGDSDTSNGFKGINLHKCRQRWRATIKIDNKHVHLGYFDTPEDASRAYDKAALAHHGKFARPNFSWQSNR